MDRRLPWVLIAAWLLVGAAGTAAISASLDGRSTGVVWTVTVESAVGWALVWMAMLLPRITTLTAARIGVPIALAVAGATFFTGGDLTASVIFVVTALAALAALASPVTIDAFIDGSSYGPEQRFALRTPPLTALVAVPPTWLVAGAIVIVPPLAVTGNLVVALAIGVAWVVGVRWAVRSLHLPARRWVVFVPAGMVLSDPYVLTDRVLFPRRNVEALGPAYAATDATDLSQGSFGLALQLDLSEPFAMPLLDRSSQPDSGTVSERTVTTDRIVFAVLRPGALLDAAAGRRFAVGETRPAEPQCLHHAADDGADELEPEESQTAVPLPRTRSSR
ncbi:MAG TPA: hypothetical protein VFN21_09485 [Acidimicrobiales bacterium]|nr:hypothetical protein [Acidimicrobiales bacterium]